MPSTECDHELFITDDDGNVVCPICDDIAFYAEDGGDE